MTDQKNVSIIQIENLLSEEEFSDLVSLIHKYNTDDNFIGWKFGGFSNSESRHKPFWNINLINESYFSEYLFGIIKKRIYEITNEEVELLRVYLNGATFGQQGYAHVDGEDDEDRTLLIYCNTNWFTEWGGATAFLECDQVTTVFPKCRKAVYFKGNISHCSHPFTRDYFGLRITLAYKLKVKK